MKGANFFGKRDVNRQSQGKSGANKFCSRFSQASFGFREV